MPGDRGSAADEFLREFTTLPESQRIAWLGARAYTSWCDSEGYGSRAGLADWAASWRTFLTELEHVGLMESPDLKFLIAFVEYFEWQLGKGLLPAAT